MSWLVVARLPLRQRRQVWRWWIRAVGGGRRLSFRNFDKLLPFAAAGDPVALRYLSGR